jgi:deoxyadenosine/deoxycytidine kinase
MNYNFIAIEGNIGSGKTSLARLISGDHTAKLILERFEDNSFLPKFYQNPDQYAFPLEMSFLADRYQQLKEELKSGELFSLFTVADYFIDKSLIFARQTLKNDEYGLYARLFEIITASLTSPDLIVYLYNNTANLLKNISNRGRDYEKAIQSSYLDKIQKGYFDYFRISARKKILIIDIQNMDFVARPDDYLKIKSCIFSDYPPGIHRITF